MAFKLTVYLLAFGKEKKLVAFDDDDDNDGTVSWHKNGSFVMRVKVIFGISG